ncbi:polyprenol monophosphomannose synthase [Pseudonocardia halophobica]|uniref:Dolichol-phosphate mannosyltransferase n=1 Tax=Pseudonocardia halophobica TaxID=29401 RepID=A0A9W6NVQ1_9PSEU|nr:polyprenol monophosphomannose synthase [Pseudonocardia halophobica]GLL11084.1 dolichol-phosphate mannosyltransferase [Pseudonocardia halophobica]
MAEPPGPVLVVIPTYEERENLGRVVARLNAAVPDADILVVDDASPDGTGELAEEMAAKDPRVRVLHREGKNGLGAAYLAGFRHALSGEHQVVVEMDADGSHAPEDLPALLAALEEGAGADLVLGSRYVPGGEVVNWPAHREWLSRGANLYARLALGADVRDITAGYRVYRRQVLEQLDLDSVISQGYCFQIDLAWRALQAGFRVVEVPITFTERQIGSSKMDGAVMLEAFVNVARWGFEHRFRRFRPARGTRDTAAGEGSVRA